MNGLPHEAVAAGLSNAALLLVAKLTFLLLAARLTTAALRKSSASLRHLVWAAAVAGSLCLPFLPGLLPDWEVVPSEVSIANAMTAAIVATTPVTGEAAATAVLAGDAAAPDAPVPGAAQDAAPNASARATWMAVAVALWLLGFGIVLARLVAGLWRVRRVVARSAATDEALFVAAFDECIETLGLNRRTRLLLSNEVGVPFVSGWRRPVVVLPAAARAWGAGRLRPVLLHELAHARRFDTVSTVLAGLATAVYWFHPLIWVAARRLKLEMETAADDCVLNAGAESFDYARHLLDVSRAAASPAPAAAHVALAQPSQLGGRVMAILSPQRNRTPVGRIRLALVVLAAALAVLPLASMANYSQRADEGVSPADRAALIRTLSGFYEALNVGEDYHVTESSYLAGRYFEPPDMTLETMDPAAWRAAFENTIEMMTKNGLVGPLTAEARVKSIRREGDGYVMILETRLETRKFAVESVVEDGTGVRVKVARDGDGQPLPAEDAYVLRPYEQSVRFSFEEGSWKIAEYGDGLTVRRMDTDNPYGPIYLVWVEDLGAETTPFGPMIAKVIPDIYRPFNNAGITFVLED